MSSLTYPSKPNGAPRVCKYPKDVHRDIPCEHHEASTLEEITHRLVGSTTYSKLGT